MSASVWYEYIPSLDSIFPFLNFKPFSTFCIASLYSSSFFIYPNSFIFVKTVFVLFIILLELSLSEKGLYEFGELFIPAKNAHSSSVKFCTDLLK